MRIEPKIVTASKVENASPKKQEGVRQARQLMADAEKCLKTDFITGAITYLERAVLTLKSVE